MFRGSFEHSVDEKGRVAIPSPFRKLLGQNENSKLIITKLDKCLVAYPLDIWEQLEEKLSSLPQFDPKVVAFQRYFISNATECPLDKSGRILLTPSLREFSGIDKDCMIVGALKKFELWSNEKWNEVNTELTATFSSLTAAMGELGINI